MTIRIEKAGSEALDDFEDGRIDAATYAERTIEQTRRLVRSTPIPDRPHRSADEADARDEGPGRP